MGNVHQTRFKTSVERVNRYAVGKAKSINRIKAVNSGFIALPSACKTPCTATLNPINIKLKLAIRTAFVHTSVSATELPPDSAKSSASGFAIISNKIVIIRVTATVPKTPTFIQAAHLCLSLIP